MQRSLLSAKEVHNNTNSETHSLFDEGKAFALKAKSDQCVINAYRFLSDPITATVDTRTRSPTKEEAEKKAVSFNKLERKNHSSQKIHNESQLDDYIRDRWSDYERPGETKPEKSSYLLYSDHWLFLSTKWVILMVSRFIDEKPYDFFTRSALNVTQGLMETVLTSFNVFDCLKEFIILFDCGRDNRGLEFYPPPCVHRDLKHGFGTRVLRVASNLFWLTC